MLQTLSYIINVAPDGVPQVVKLSQNENGRTLAFALTGVGTVNIPSGSTVTISGTKPDGVVYSATGTLSGNVASFSETTQMTAVSGIWPAKIKVTYNGETIATCKIVMAIDPDPVAPGSVPSSSQLNGLVAEAQQYATYAKEEAYGSPLVAATAAAMTDKTRVYVYTGSETGKTAGHWYFWNGSAWTDGGVYNSQGINTDTTLTLAGMAADAKATGDEFTRVKQDINELEDFVEILLNRYTWLIRTLSNGVIAGSTTRIATTDFIPISVGDVIHSDIYDFVVAFYATDSESGYVSATDYVHSYKATTSGYVRLVSRRTDSGTITSDDLATIPKYIFMNGSLTKRVNTLEEKTAIYDNTTVVVDNLGVEIDANLADETWLIRTISNGVIAGSTTRIATTNFIKVETGDHFFSSDYDFTVSFYTADNEASYVKTTDYINNYICTESGYIRLVSRRSDYGAITQTDLATIPTKIFRKTYSEKTNDLIDVAKTELMPSASISFLGNPTLGDATAIKLSSGICIGIDAGNYATRELYLEQLQNRGITHFDAFVISHYHPDHCGGLSNLRDSGIVDNTTVFYLPQDLNTSALENIIPDYSSVKTWYDTVNYIISNLGARKIYPTEQKKIDFGVAYLLFWNADHTYYYTHSTNYNDFSLCCDFVIGNMRIAFTGDIGNVAQEHCAGTIYPCNILKAQHHGWDGGANLLVPAYINNISPEMVVSIDSTLHSTSYIDTAQSPMQSWCEANGVPNYRTTINGNAIDVRVSTESKMLLGKYSRYIRNGKNWKFDDNSGYQE